MKHNSELNQLENKAKKDMLSLNCKDCPIYNSCEMKMSIACNFIYLQAYKAGYNRHEKEMRLKKKK